jgi:tetratricopeptide (TPR) repeat protein
VASGKPAEALLSIAAFRRAEPPRAGEAEDLLKAVRLKTQGGDPAAGAELYGAYLDRFSDKPGAEEATLAVAREAARRGDWPSARQALEKARPGPQRDLLLAQACSKMGDNAAAQEAAERALAAPLGLGPDAYVQASLLAAETAQARGLLPQAALYYGQYALYAPATPANHKPLLDAAMVLQNAQMYDAALAAFEKLQKVSRDPAVSFQYAYTLELAGRKEDALKAFLKTARSPSPMWAPTARYRAAELYAELGKLKEAVAIYRDLAASAKGTAQGEFAKRRLEELQAQLAAAQGAKPAAAAAKPAEKKPASAKKPASKPKPASPSKPKGTP